MGNVKDRAQPPPDHRKELVRAVEALGYRHGHWQVFADFVETAAISVSNAVDWAGREKREDRYLQVVKRYKPDELKEEWMWHLHMAERGGEWKKIGEFETLSAVAARINESEGIHARGVFFEVHVELDFGSDAEFLGNLEHTGRKTGRCYVAKRVCH